MVTLFMVVQMGSVKSYMVQLLRFPITSCVGVVGIVIGKVVADDGIVLRVTGVPQFVGALHT